MTGGTPILGNHHMVLEAKPTSISVFLSTQVGVQAIKWGLIGRNGGLVQATYVIICDLIGANLLKQ